MNLEALKIDQHDHMISGISQDKSYRVACISLKETLIEAQKRHQLNPLATIAIGRAFCGIGLLGSTIKKDELFLKMEIRGQGKMPLLIAEYVAPSSLRAFVTEQDYGTEVPDSLREAFGEGTMTIRKGSKAAGGESYSSMVELVSGEISEDLAHFFAHSEQIPSIVSCGVKLDSEGKIEAAGGFLIQKIAGDELDEDKFAELGEQVRQKAISLSLSEGKKPKELIKDIMGADLLDSKQTAMGFHCFCSRERMSSALTSLGASELKQIKLKTGKIESSCHFCKNTFTFTLHELLFS